MLSLDEIGIHHRTDKTSVGHGYLDFYETYFSAFRHRDVKVLEVGILDGASLKTWRDYFEAGKIIGADINPATRRFAGERIDVEILDQSNIESLIALAVKHGPFDIIVEDGSHLWEHQITTLRTLFPFLKTGGVYVVEDLETNYGALAENFRGNSSISCMDYLKKALDLRVAGDQIDIDLVEDAFLRTYARSMTMCFSKHCCLIQKEYVYSGIDENVTGPPLQAIANPEFQPSITAHYGNVADVLSVDGAVSRDRPGETIQGFTATPSISDIQLEYRAFADRNWSAWARNEHFVGTRGINLPLGGFAFRLADRAADRYDLEVIGRFGRQIVRVGNGEDCLSPNGQQLNAIQVVIRAKG